MFCRLQEENRLPNCEEGMRARNELLGDTYTGYQSVLEKMYTYISLALQSEGTLYYMKGSDRCYMLTNNLLLS